MLIHRIALLLLAAGVLWAQTNEGVGGDYVRPFERLLTERFEANRQLRDAALAQLTSEPALRARQKFIRESFIAALGGLPAAKSPLNARVTGALERDGYIIEKVVFESLPGFRVTANLYVPRKGPGPFPALLGTAGHSAVGKAADTYQSVWVTLARRGYVVLAYDPPGQGERFEYLDHATGKSTVGAGVPEHNMTGMQVMLTGQNIARYFVWDGIRAFDYLLTRKEVDPRRIAVAGNSGGGTQSAYQGIADPRLAAVISSCYPTDWRHLWSPTGPQDAEQVLAGWLRDGFDFSDFMLAVAPRPFLISSAEKDYFPIGGARQTFQESRAFYRVFGREDRLRHATAPEQHGWTKPLREAAYQWLSNWLDVPGAGGPEDPLQLEDPAFLNVTPTGQLQSSVGSRTIREMNRERAAALRKQRGPATPAKVRAALQMAALSALPKAEDKGSFAAGAIRVEKLELEVESGIRIPAFLYLPSGATPRPGIVFASSAGKASNELGESALSLAQKGHVVLAVDPRAMGEAAPPPRKGGYTALYQLSARGWLMGESLAGMQVNDLLAAARYLRSRPEVAPAGLVLRGQGTAGPLALFAAALDPGIAGVVTERSIASFEALVNAEIYRDMENLIVPGLLEHLDLPEVVQLIGKQKVTVLSPATF
jgi:cephalosporin-C deacetylase-like acetyl esterase